MTAQAFNPPSASPGAPVPCENDFLRLAESIGQVFALMEVESGETRFLYLSPGIEKLRGFAPSHFCAHQAAWFEGIHPEDRVRMKETLLQARLNQGHDEEYRVMLPDGSTRWVRERAMPVAQPPRDILRLAAVIEDITASKTIAKHVLEMDDQERFRIGQDLHDGVCQQLVGIAFTADILWKNLKSRTPEEALRAEKIRALLDGAIFQARTLSQALYPVNLGGGGLSVALRALGDTVRQSTGVSVYSECSDTARVRSGTLAMHIYRIAQEAAYNAAHHSCPNEIGLRFAEEGAELILEITDNGLLRDEQGDAAYENGVNGIRFRTSLVGGTVKVTRNIPGGTVVRCSFANSAPNDGHFEQEF